MRKKIFALYLGFILIVLSNSLIITYANSSEAKDITVMLDSVKLEFDTKPIIYSDRVLVPMRVIMEGLKFDVKWDAVEKSVKATKNDIEINLKINDISAYVNNKVVSLDVPSIILDGRTLVPLRFVAENSGARVQWNGETYQVDIDTLSPIIKLGNMQKTGSTTYSLDSVSNPDFKNYYLLEGKISSNTAKVEVILKNKNGEFISAFLTYPEKSDLGYAFKAKAYLNQTFGVATSVFFIFYDNDNVKSQGEEYTL